MQSAYYNICYFTPFSNEPPEIAERLISMTEQLDEWIGMNILVSFTKKA